MMVIGFAIAIILVTAIPYILWKIISILPNLLWVCSKVATFIIIFGAIVFCISWLSYIEGTKLNNKTEYAPKKPIIENINEKK